MLAAEPGATAASDFPDPNEREPVRQGVSGDPGSVERGHQRLQGPAATEHAEREADAQAAVGERSGSPSASATAASKDFPDPVNGEPRHRQPVAGSHPPSKPGGWYGDPQRRDEEVRQRPGTRQRGPVVRAKAGRWPQRPCWPRPRRRGRDVRCGAPDRGRRAPAADTVKVQKGKLSAMVSQGGTLTYRARLGRLAATR